MKYRGGTFQNNGGQNMIIKHTPEDGGQHYRPNLRPANPGKSYRGRHKVEVLSKKNNEGMAIGFSLNYPAEKGLKGHAFKVQDTSSHVQIVNLAQWYIQPH